MTVTPVGIISASIDNLRTLIASTPEFQQWTGSAEALSRIHIKSEPEIQALVRPFAVVDLHDNYGWKQQASSGCFTANSDLLLIIEDTVDDNHAGNDADAFMAFSNRIGTLIGDLMNLSGTGELMQVTEIQIEGGLERFTMSEGDFYRCQMIISYAGGR